MSDKIFGSDKSKDSQSDFKKRVFVVTGAGGGLGLGLAQELLERRFEKVIFLHRQRKDELFSLLSRFDLSPEKHCFSADLTNEESVKSVCEKIVSQWGAVEHLVNLAGASSNSMSWNLSWEAFRKILDANLGSAFLMSKTLLPSMRSAGYGRIINTSSVVSTLGAVGACHYASAKAAINGMTRTMALEVANKGITVNALALGYFDRGLIDEVSPELQSKIKDQIPMKRFGHPREFAGLIEFLLSEAGAYTTGQTLHISGGLV